MDYTLDKDISKSTTHSELASVGLRTAAHLIDLAVAIAALLLAAIMLSRLPNNALSILGIVGAIAVVLGVLVYQSASLAMRGQSIGKAMMRIRVITHSEATNPGFVKAVLLRWWLPSLIYTIPYLGWAFWIADCLCIFRQGRRCLHDRMADTIVVVVARN